MAGQAQPAPAALPRSRRLSASEDFSRLLRSKRRSAGPWFVVSAVSNAGDEARLGLAISKRAAPRAHDRNRLKRLARESFRHSAVRLQGLDVLVSARPAARRQSGRALLAALDGHWRKLGACSGPSSS